MLEQILSFFIATAHAEPTADAAQQQGSPISFLVMFGVLFLFMYFFMWRPQSKRAKEQQNLLSSLGKGDEVVTAGGLLGKITKISDQYITLEISNDVEMLIQKAAVINVLPKGTIKSLN